jgi:pimeloyl-ACP methyl ester carboxylesterase
MKPIEFGGCSGWLHPAAGSRGVVLCSPFGYEQLCIHRVWRDLADEIAAAGMPALRFDWHGTGDSAGSDTDPARLDAWMTSLRGAIQRLRQETGVSEIYLVGLRLGGTLATLIAEEMADIKGLVLMAPVVSGKAHVREMRALAAFGGAPRAENQNDASGSGDIEAAGFVITGQTAADLKALDLPKMLRNKPADRVLLMHRPDAPAEAKLAKRLADLGVAVEESDIPMYGDFVCDSEWSTVPRVAFDRLITWLKDGAGKGTLQLDMMLPARLRLPHAMEESVTLPGRAKLIGTVCMPIPPATPLPHPGRPAILFLNTGWYARMGANRIAVTLARHYAEQGFTSLRLDFAGVGDSAAAPEGGSLVYNLKSCTDVSAAIDWLEARGHKQVVLFGMCSGAYLGFQASQRDKRVVGQVLINPQRFEWTEKDTLEMSVRTAGLNTSQLLGDGLRAAFTPGKLGRLLTGDPAAWRMARKVGERTLQSLRSKLSFSSDTKVAGEMRESLQRGVKTMLVFSAGDAGLVESASQFGEGLELLAPRRNFGFEIIEGASHTLAELASRERLTRLMDGFLAPWAADVAVEPVPQAKAA